MVTGVFIILCWLGFSKFDLDRDIEFISPKEFNRLLELR